jgi:hypothetical protein
MGDPARVGRQVGLVSGLPSWRSDPVKKEVRMSNEINQRARKLLAKKLPWKKVKTATYKDAPHEYISWRDCEAEWDDLAAVIKKYGEYRGWRGKRYKYFAWNGMIYWAMWPVINRTFEAALDNGGYPSKADQKRIYERFWGGKE